MSDQHDYLLDQYLALHDSPMQQHFRRLAPMPFGVVFLPWEGLTEDELRRHYRLMKELGFTNLKQIMEGPGWSKERLLTIALEEGVIPFWYGEGGWEPITDELCQRLSIDPALSMDEIRNNPAMIAHQTEVLRKRITYEPIKLDLGISSIVFGYEGSGETVPISNDPVLVDELKGEFAAWCREQYGDIESLNDAWNTREVGISPGCKPFTSWDDFDPDRHNQREYRRIRDILRFKADVILGRLRKRCEAHAARDPHEPQRAGGEMGLFLPFAWRATDMEGYAELMREYGSFYPSLHLAWHFEEVGYEVTRCIYMQSSICVDWFKGGWSATWESTGGPQQFSGGKGWNGKAAEETAGFTCDQGTMAQLQLSYLAGGFKGVGIWSWNCRRAGWEAGEYQLLDRNGEPCERTYRAGSIAKAANRYRDELWNAFKEPTVGVLVNWDQECIWAAISESNRDKYRHIPIRSRIGAARALINGNIPWEHVLASDLRAGLAGRYRSIYIPTHISVDRDLIAILTDYVREGGRVVCDAPSFWLDERGRVLPTNRGSAFEQLFGVQLRDFQYSNNVPYILHHRRCEGWTCDLEATSAQVNTYFSNGAPAITEHHLGKGSAVFIGAELSHQCFEPGHEDLEQLIRSHALGSHSSPYRCDDAIVYRLAGEKADHYFFMNDHEAQTVHLDTGNLVYTACEDAETGEQLALGAPIALERHGARWLRLSKE